MAKVRSVTTTIAALPFPIAALLAFFCLNTALMAQNGITAAEGIPISGQTGVDALWSDSADKRWKVNNHNSASSPADLAVWACPSQLGGIVYSGSPILGASNAEACLSLSATAGVPLLTGAAAPQWGGNSTISP